MAIDINADANAMKVLAQQILSMAIIGRLFRHHCLVYHQPSITGCVSITLADFTGDAGSKQALRKIILTFFVTMRMHEMVGEVERVITKLGLREVS